MKSLFKTFLLLSLSSAASFKLHARDIILIENLASKKEGEMLLNIIEEKFKIPKTLITYKNINGPCQKNSEAIMQLCLEANGELTIVKVNKFVVENSLRVFQDVE